MANWDVRFGSMPLINSPISGTRAGVEGFVMIDATLSRRARSLELRL
jgi:hypothetical protein